MTGQRRSGKRGSLKAMRTVYITGVKAVFRRRRRAAYTGDAGARRDELAKLAVRVGSGVAGARMRSLFAGRDRRRRIREAASLAASQDVVATLGEMKGGAMKVAQLGAVLMPMSEDAERELVKLQADAPAMEPDRIVAVLEEQLGDDVMSRFESFDMAPIAAASIGQVHRARLLDGRDVVVKIQYPGVEQAVLADLDVVGDYAKMYALMGFDFGDAMENLKRTVRDELDYATEAANQRQFAAMYAGHPFVKVPDVVDELSTRRVLTSEFVPGARLYDVLDRPQEQRDQYAEIVFRFALGSILQGLFTGDPHPGNYIFMDDGRVCFIDFGFVERFDDVEGDVARYRAPIVAALTGDTRGLDAGLRGLGLAPRKGKFDGEKMWREIRPWLYGPVGSDEPVALDMKRFTEDIALIGKVPSEFMKIRKSKGLVPWVLMLMRYVPGTAAVMARLRAEGNWHRIARELVLDEAPQTEIGKRWAAVASPVVAPGNRGRKS